MGRKTEQKRLREAAAQRELERRRQQAESDCPFTRDEYQSFIDAVVTSVLDQPREVDLFHARQYLAKEGFPSEPVVRFLQSQKIASDWDILFYGDEHQVFGPTSDRICRMPINREDLEELFAYLDFKVRESGCNRRHEWTSEWLIQNEQPINLSIAALMSLGGGCDCEVVLNVDPDVIYP